MENFSENGLGHPTPELRKKYLLYILAVVLFFSIAYFFLVRPPRDFPVGAVVNIEKGWSLGKISSVLKNDGVIRSRVAFEFFVILFGGEKRIQPAYYNFERKLPVFTVAYRVGGGKFHMAPVVITIPEGFTAEEIAETFSKKLPNFSKEEFFAIAEDKEGYLFPDTYFFLNTDGAKEALASLEKNFNKKIEPLRSDIAASGKTLDEIIIMASIIEGEANGDDDRALISGVLWQRIKRGMRLQADAAPLTYKEGGLPEEPIGNPGLEAIKAAIFPQASPYLYYLHDADGNIHYARTLAEHNANIRAYLKD